MAANVRTTTTRTSHQSRLGPWFRGAAGGWLLSAWLMLSAAGCATKTISPTQQQRVRLEALRCLKWLSFDDSTAVRCAALEALSDAAPKEAVDEFKFALSDEYWGVRFAACIGLAHTGDPNAAALLKRQMTDSHPAVHAAATYALHRLGDYSYTTQLADMLLNHPEPTVRRVTAQLLGRLGEPRSVKLLRRALADREEAVRWEATAAMARLGDKTALQQLMFFANSGFSDQQTFALLELALINEPRCEELFRYRLSEGPHLETRVVAARGLGRLGYKDGLPLALKTLRFKTPDLSPDVVKRDPPHQQIVRKRSMAALALGAIADPSALPRLRETIMTDDHAVRVAAAQAIIQIVDHATPAGPEAQASALPAAR